MSIRTRTVSGSIIAFIGLLIAMGEFAVRWYYAMHREHYDMDAWPILFGCVVIFLGGFIIDNKRAEDAGGFVVTSATKIIETVRSGRRTTDTVVQQTTVTPVPAPETPGTVITPDSDKP